VDIICSQNIFEKKNPSYAYISNILVRPSYISLEYALAHYGLIPETVQIVQAVTTKRPLCMSTSFADFHYRHVKNSWFFGYEEAMIQGTLAFIAKPEKALLDCIYFMKGPLTIVRIHEWRLQNIEILNLDTMMKMAKNYGKKKIVCGAEKLKEFIEREL